MSDNETLVENDLDAFSAEFFQTKEVKEVKAEEPVVTDDDEDTDEKPDDDAVATEDSDDEAEDEEQESEDHDDDEEEPEPEPKKNRKTAKERIQELNTKLRETERAAAAERAETTRRLAELEAKLNTPKEEAKKEVGKLPSGAPDPNADGEDGEAIYPLGEFDPAYIRDLTRFTIKTEQEAAETYRREAAENAEKDQAREQVRNHWASNLEAAEKELPDVREKIGMLGEMFQNVDGAYGQYLVDVVMTLDAGPHILHYLATNPKEAREIVNSGPASATLALGRLDAKLSKTKAREEAPKRVSAAPAPPTKITRGTGGKARISADTDDLDAFEKAFYKR